MKKGMSVLLSLVFIGVLICSPNFFFTVPTQAETVDTTSVEEIALTEEIVSAENVSCEEIAGEEPYAELKAAGNYGSNTYLGATALPGEHLVLKAIWQ